MEDTVRGWMDLAGGILYAVGFIPYVLSIWRTRKMVPGAHGKIEPAKASWIVWGVIDTIILAGMRAEGCVNGQILGAVIGVWTVVILTLRFGKAGWATRDKFCIGIGIAGLVLWKVFSNPELGILFGLGGTLIAAYPTYVGAWKDPSHEDKLAWTIFAAACVCALAGVPDWTLTRAGLPVVFFAIDTPVTLMIYFRPRSLAGKNAAAQP